MKTKQRKMSASALEIQETIMRACGSDPRAFKSQPIEDEVRHRQEAEQRAALQQQRGEKPIGEALDRLMARLSDRFAATGPVSESDMADYEWREVAVPHLQSLGLESRHIRRIAPRWANPAQERVFGEVSTLCARTGAVVAMIGSRGTGKTTIAAQLMRTRFEARRAHFKKELGDREMFDPPEPGRYVKLGELGGMFKALYADFGTIERDALAERLKAWIDLELLVIDEIHESEDLKTHARLLVDIVDHRYARRHDTILISNHDGAEFKRVINPSILSRIGEAGKVIECRWQSYRTGK